MEKILFVTNSFGMGGAEKVLLDIVSIEKQILMCMSWFLHDSSVL